MQATIRYGPNAKPESVRAHALSVLEEILAAADLSACMISSTARTPADQARVMYENVERWGVAHQKRLYAAAGDMVIDVYSEGKRKDKPEVLIKLEMEQEIVEIGAERISHHCADPAVLCVFDVAPSSIANKAAFEQAARADKRVSKFLVPPADPAYHLEIPQPK
jgi:hypothetical protein